MKRKEKVQNNLRQARVFTATYIRDILVKDEKLSTDDIKSFENSLEGLYNTKQIQGPPIDELTFEEYKALNPKDKKAMEEKLRCKNKGGIIGGKATSRLKSKLEYRDLVILDVDEVSSDYSPMRIHKQLIELGYNHLIYTTCSHSSERPRYRIIMLLPEPVYNEDLFKSYSRYMADRINYSLKTPETPDLDIFDKSTHEWNRVFFLPAITKGGLYEKYLYNEGKDIEIFNEKFIKQIVEGDTKKYNKQEKDLEDQIKRDKTPYYINIFNDYYSIETAIEAYLSDIYEEASGGRYKYIDSSSPAGLVLYSGENTCYSFHANDPAYGKRLEPFDLVRIHRFGNEDIKETNRAMRDMLMEDQNIGDDIKKAKEDYINKNNKKMSKKNKNNNIGFPITEDWHREFQLLDNGDIIPNAHNLELIFTNDSNLQGLVAYDESTHRIEVLKRFFPQDNSKNVYVEIPRQYVEDSDKPSIRVYLDKTYNIRNRSLVDDAFKIYIQKNRVNGLTGYLSSLKWDGVPRLETMFIDYLGAEDTELNRALTKVMLLGAVARAYRPGTKFDYTLVLQGPEGIGKSFILSKLGDIYFRDHLGDLGNKDAKALLSGAWIVEFAELSDLSKSKSEEVKSFLTSTFDLFRPPYGREEVEYKRQCVFFGTTNDSEFLTGGTGNRRFPVIRCGVNKQTKLVHEDFDGERDQIWAEAVALYNQGESIWLSPEMTKAYEQEQEKHRVVDNRVETIIEHLTQKAPANFFNLSNIDKIAYYRDKLNKDKSKYISCPAFGDDTKVDIPEGGYLFLVSKDFISEIVLEGDKEKISDRKIAELIENIPFLETTTVQKRTTINGKPTLRRYHQIIKPKFEAYLLELGIIEEGEEVEYQ